MQTTAKITFNFIKTLKGRIMNKLEKMNFLEDEIKEIIEIMRDKNQHRYAENDEISDITKKELMENILIFDWEREYVLEKIVKEFNLYDNSDMDELLNDEFLSSMTFENFCRYILIVIRKVNMQEKQKLYNHFL